MKKGPVLLISVIVPVYKVEPYLDQCVSSIVGQTYRNIEIILVDDGSPDRCPAMCDEWAGRDARIKVIHKQNGGLSDARNVGVAAAAGQYIGFVDSDDWIEADMYEKLLQSIRESGSDIAACSVEMFWEDGKKRMLTQQIHCILNAEEAEAALLAESALKHPVWNKLYRSDLAKSIPFAVGKYHEDVFWTYQAVGRAERISIIEDIGYHYLQRSQSIMGDAYSLKRLDALEAHCQRYQFIKEAFPALESKARLNVYLNCFYHMQMTLLYLEKTDRKIARARLIDIRRKHMVQCADYANLKITHKLWIIFSKISFIGTCRLKNLLKIGL